MSEASHLVLSNCNIIDATSASPRQGRVVISEGRIRDVALGPSVGAVDGADVLDAQGGFVLPGFWDVHTHIARSIPDIEARDEPTPVRAIRAGRNCIDALRHGVTGLRVVGERDYIDVAWKRAFDSGQFLGPSLFTCGYFHNNYSRTLFEQRLCN